MKCFAPDIDAKAPGTTFKEVSGKIVAAVPFPLAPLGEQHRIVAKVDELMTLCDQLEAARAEREARRDRLAAASLARLNAPSPGTFLADAQAALGVLPSLTARADQIKQFRQTILNLAVRGNLVEQDPADEPASDLLRRIAEVKAKLGKARKDEMSTPVLERERSFRAPCGWIWTRLIDVGFTQTGTSPSSSRQELFGDFIPFVKPAALDGATIRYDGPGLSREGMAHSRVAPARSVMLVCIGATLGKVNVTDREICFNQQINSLTPWIGEMHEFLALALKASDFQGMAWARAGTGTLPIISKGKWEVLPIPVPPLAEQRRIVAKAQELMALCDQLEASLASADDTRRRLLDALLAEALQPALQAAA
jgi:type I restriction enzyme S subunit